jgi:hypothetical protein
MSLCPGCGLAAADGDVVTIDEKVWHLACVTAQDPEARRDPRSSAPDHMRATEEKLEKEIARMKDMASQLQLVADKAKTVPSKRILSRTPESR